MHSSFSDEELKKLHEVLFMILGDVLRVCKNHGIKCFVIGGSAIGVYYWKNIVPSDDDIDLGMTRDDYEKFLQIAQQELGDKYFVQNPLTEPHTPYYFTKIMLKGTTFLEHEHDSNLKCNGIFIDIFPFDHVPDDLKTRNLHRKRVNTINNWLIAKDQWQWKYIHKCETDTPAQNSFLNCLVMSIARSVLSKRQIYKLLLKFQTMYNKKSTVFSNAVVASVDLVSNESLNDLKEAQFGNYTVYVPGDLETYLHNHYPNLKKNLSTAEKSRYSHHLVKLDFGPYA